MFDMEACQTVSKGNPASLLFLLPVAPVRGTILPTTVLGLVVSLLVAKARLLGCNQVLVGSIR